jgi:hypothetical protein
MARFYRIQKGLFRKYLFSLDHKTIGLQYALTSLIFLLIGRPPRDHPSLEQGCHPQLRPAADARETGRDSRGRAARLVHADADGSGRSRARSCAAWVTTVCAALTPSRPSQTSAPGSHVRLRPSRSTRSIRTIRTTGNEKRRGAVWTPRQGGSTVTLCCSSRRCRRLLLRDLRRARFRRRGQGHTLGHLLPVILRIPNRDARVGLAAEIAG